MQRRILLVPSAYLPNVGGIEEVTRRLAAGLQGRDMGVVIATNRWPSTTQPHETVEGVEVERLPFELPAANIDNVYRFATTAPRAARTFVGLVREYSPDIVHVIGAGPNAAYVAALRRRLRVPVVLSTHGELSGDANDVFRRSITLRLALRVLTSSAAAISAPSAHTLRELEAAYPVRGLAEVISNGVDATEFAAATPRRDLGRYVLSVGRLVPQKGFDSLIEAFGRVRESLEGRRLVIAGEGPERGALERQISRLGLTDSVLLLGVVDRGSLPSLYAGADLVVLASRREAFGIVALEAMAAGVPVLATSAGGLAEVVGDDRGLLVPPDDVAQLAAGLRRLLDDTGLRERLRTNGAREASRRSWSAVVGQYVRLYERALE